MTKEQKEAEKSLIDSFARWDYLMEYGGSDPNWEDGCNLNCVRNHIIYQKKNLEELEYFPDIYNRETPQEVDNKFMARADEIREHAKQSLIIYKRDRDYLYLVNNRHKVNKKDAEHIHIDNVIGYVTGLEMFIKQDNLLRMRLHEHPERYQESFKQCRIKMEKLIGEPKVEKVGQLSIMDLLGTQFDIVS
ncbi:hypothetical protein [Anaerosporobacter faecicola]|uniref:hypothetical protein n=1 Tax=Anaerosporobacter faecicola TaxID=2718714 RepID=UPI00143A0097|nr:hypothetical protein [Anaerosporobacter faecicola]